MADRHLHALNDNSAKHVDDDSSYAVFGHSEYNIIMRNLEQALNLVSAYLGQIHNIILKIVASVIELYCCLSWYGHRQLVSSYLYSTHCIILVFM